MKHRDIVGKIQTVLGPIEPEQLGITMTHEHLLLDYSHAFGSMEPKDPDRKKTFNAPLNMETLSRIYYAGHWNRENFILDDEQLAIEEALHFKQHSGSTIVDVTSIGFKRNPEGLRRIAEATGLNVIMGSSFYVDPCLPDFVRTMTEDEITDHIVRDFTEGADNTDVFPGLIGEVGMSMPRTDLENRILRASVRAQRITGALLMIHPGRHPDEPLKIVEMIDKLGADLVRTVICHIDRTIFDRPRLKDLASTGVTLEYDLFGHEHTQYLYSDDVDQPNDIERLRYLRYLMDEGFANQIVISQDVDNKIYLRKYGGCGYAHIVENIVPRALRRGFTQQEIDQILVDNPRRLFTFSSPRT